MRAFPEGDWRVATAKSLLGEALTVLARYDEADSLLLDAHRALKEVPGAQRREAKVTRTRLIVLYEAWGRAEKAVPYRTRAAPMSASAPSSTSE